MNVVPEFVYFAELLVTLRTGVVVQRDVLGDAGCRLELGIAAGAGVSHFDNN
jgi:hypothetical protein